MYVNDEPANPGGNTGFKHMDPSNPHETDWKKYGRPYSSAMAHSYTLPDSEHLQRPLPAAPPPAPPRPGIWTHPGQNRPPPPVIYTGNTYIPPNAMVVQPGDPRLGG